MIPGFFIRTALRASASRARVGRVNHLARWSIGLPVTVLLTPALPRRRKTTGGNVGQLPPNNAFKPTPHRGANHMAGTACHVLHAPLRRGLTLVLGLVSRTVVAVFQAICSASLIRSVCASHARCRHRQSALRRLGFGQARLSARFDLPGRLRTVRGESSWPRAWCVSAAPDTALVVLFASGVGLPHVGRRCQGTAA